MRQLTSHKVQGIRLTTNYVASTRRAKNTLIVWQTKKKKPCTLTAHDASSHFQNNISLLYTPTNVCTNTVFTTGLFFPTLETLSRFGRSKTNDGAHVWKQNVARKIRQKKKKGVFMIYPITRKKPWSNDDVLEVICIRWVRYLMFSRLYVFIFQPTATGTTIEYALII